MQARVRRAFQRDPFDVDAWGEDVAIAERQANARRAAAIAEIETKKREKTLDQERRGAASILGLGKKSNIGPHEWYPTLALWLAVERAAGIGPFAFDEMRSHTDHYPTARCAIDLFINREVAKVATVRSATAELAKAEAKETKARATLRRYADRAEIVREVLEDRARQIAAKQRKVNKNFDKARRFYHELRHGYVQLSKGKKGWQMVLKERT